jgi:RecB family endonuclease NucS
MMCIERCMSDQSDPARRAVRRILGMANMNGRMRIVLSGCSIVVKRSENASQLSEADHQRVVIWLSMVR